MAKPNYSFEKRQRDIQKQQKKAEKLAKKAAAKEGATGSEVATDDAAAQVEPTVGETPG